jgi:4-diphosphocytidyl-2-C-methyl-D-erythritol kinase
LGSDVPFFLGGPLALCTGRGEIIQPIKQPFNFRAVLIFPDVTALTKRVYSCYEHDKDLYTGLSVKIRENLSKNRVDLITGMCVNMLECACYNGYDELAQIKTRIVELGIPGVCLSGSGSTMYILDTGKGEQDVENYQAMLKDNIGCEAILVDSNRW